MWRGRASRNPKPPGIVGHRRTRGESYAGHPPDTVVTAPHPDITIPTPAADTGRAFLAPEHPTTGHPADTVLRRNVGHRCDNGGSSPRNGAHTGSQRVGHPPTGHAPDTHTPAPDTHRTPPASHRTPRGHPPDTHRPVRARDGELRHDNGSDTTPQHSVTKLRTARLCKVLLCAIHKCPGIGGYTPEWSSTMKL